MVRTLKLVADPMMELRQRAVKAVMRRQGKFLVGLRPDQAPKRAIANSLAVRRAHAINNEHSQRSKAIVVLLLAKGESLRQIADWLNINKIGERTPQGKQHTASRVLRLIKLYDLASAQRLGRKYGPEP